jgi:hypothetical protein
VITLPVGVRVSGGWPPDLDEIRRVVKKWMMRVTPVIVLLRSVKRCCRRLVVRSE